jgi:hypothetical protein
MDARVEPAHDKGDYFAGDFRSVSVSLIAPSRYH